MSTSRTSGGAGTAPEGALRGLLPPERTSVVTRKRLERLRQRHTAGHDEDAADRLQQRALGQPPGEPRAQQRTGDRGRRADREQPPVDAARRVTDHTRDAYPE